MVCTLSDDHGVACMNNLTLFGLSLDIIGVLVLGYALVSTKDSSIERQCRNYFTFNSDLLMMLIQQKIDAQIGVSVLVTGFVFQAIGSAGYDLSEWGLLVLSGLAAVGLSATASGRWVWAERKSEVMLCDLLIEGQRSKALEVALGHVEDAEKRGDFRGAASWKRVSCRVRVLLAGNSTD